MNRIRRVPRRQLQTSYSLLKSYHARDHLSTTNLPTFHFQGALPRLPIPDLEQSLEKYIASLEALEGHPDITRDDIERVKLLVQDFLSGNGPELDRALKSEDKANPQTSFLWKPWTDMYLTDRRALPINYNPVITWKEHPNKKLNTQEHRAAQICWAAAKYFMTLDDGHLEPEVFHMKNPPPDKMVKLSRLLPKWRVSLAKYGIHDQALRYLPFANNQSYPLDMTQISNLFYSTRIPNPEKDFIKKADQSQNHVIVLYKGRFYTLDVLKTVGGKTRHVRDIHDILSDINAIKKDAERKGDTKFPISALSNTDRDTWTANRLELESLENEYALRMIDDAMFCLTLDDYEDALTYNAENKQTQIAGNNESKLISQLLWGPAQNRWVDKSFSVIVTSEGTAGLNFEHAWGDGACVLSFFNKVHEHIVHECGLTTESVGQSTPIGHHSDVVQEIKFVLSDNIKSQIQNAVEFHNTQIKDLEVSFSQNFEVTRKWMEANKIGADGFLQISLQVTHNELHGWPCATYESASTCAYQHGRTETIRPCTTDTKAVAELYHNADFDDPETQTAIDAAIRKAVKTHNSITKDCLTGEGFDRHIFGLRHQAKIRGEEMPEFVTDKTFATMNHFRMSTSTLNSPNVKFGGFGPVVDDGYALGYMVYDDFIGVVSAAKPVNGVDPYDFTKTVNKVWINLQKCVNEVAKRDS